MKKLLCCLALAALVAPGWAGEASPARATLSIQGMTCGGCVASVKYKLKRTKGVIDYEVSLDRAEADVDYDPRETDPGEIAEAVSETGFETSVKRGKGDDENE